MVVVAVTSGGGGGGWRECVSNSLEMYVTNIDFLLSLAVIDKEIFEDKSGCDRIEGEAEKE